MQRIAVFPGSFDPITLGHIDIIHKGLSIFDRVIVGIGNNADKKYMFPVSNRETWIKDAFANEPRVEVQTYSGLTIDFCKKASANFILRGLRNAADFEFEKAIAHMNHSMANNIETIFVLSEQIYGSLSSSIVRDIIRNDGDAGKFLPKSVRFIK